jgi:intracellular septation protein A
LHTAWIAGRGAPGRVDPQPRRRADRGLPVSDARPAAGGDDIDTARLKKNLPAIITDLALGVLFFVAAKLTDLRTAALIGAGAGIALYGVQWVLDRVLAKRIDLLGGLAMFGIVMLLLSAAFAYAFDSDFMVQLRPTVIGGLAAVLFGVDALFGGRYLGRRLAVYIAYADIDVRRLAQAFAAVGALLAVLNVVVALAFSKDIWLWYSLWGDIILAVLLAQWAIRYARRPVAAAADAG